VNDFRFCSFGCQLSPPKPPPLPRGGKVNFTQVRQKAALFDKNSIGGDLIRN
jgi:hypothetical protein